MSQLEVSEHGIFHGIEAGQETKPLPLMIKKGIFTIEWE